MFTVLFTSLVNNLATIFAFIGTGVVNFSHVGIGPFLLALGLSLLFTFVGFVIGIRVTLYYALTLGATMWYIIMDM